MNSLPKGWAPKPSRSKLYPIPAIVVCSFLLAFSIVGVIVISAFIRRRRKARLRAADVEGERGIPEKPSSRPPTSRLRSVPDDESDEDDEVMIQKKLASTTAVSTSGIGGKDSKVLRWRGRLIPSALRSRRRRRKDQSSYSSVASRRPGVAVSQVENAISINDNEDAVTDTNVTPDLLSQPTHPLSLSVSPNTSVRSPSRSEQHPGDSVVSTSLMLSSPQLHSGIMSSSTSVNTGAQEQQPPRIDSQTPAICSSEPAEHVHVDDINRDSLPSHLQPTHVPDASPPAYARRRTSPSANVNVNRPSSPAFLSSSIDPPLPVNISSFGRWSADDAELADGEVEEMNEQDWGRGGHIATDDKTALARLAQMRSEPVEDSSTSSMSLSGRRGAVASMPSSSPLPSSTSSIPAAVGLLNVPDEETLMMYDADAIEAEAIGVGESDSHGPRVVDVSWQDINSSMITHGEGASSSLPHTASHPASSSLYAKPSNDPLPAHFHQTSRRILSASTIGDEDAVDYVPEYSSSSHTSLPPVSLPSPVVHAATAREFARLARVENAELSEPVVLSSPVEASASAPPLENDVEDIHVQASAPPLDFDDLDEELELDDVLDGAASGSGGSSR